MAKRALAKGTVSASCEFVALHHSEGRVTKQNNGAYRYEYTLKDHLGNGRVYFTDANNDNIINENDILQEQNYYAFGAAFDVGSWYSNASNVSPDKYQYNDKELNDDFGLNWHDYGARWYDANLGRFWTIDPLASVYSNQSTFAYAANDPISMIDYMGMGPEGADGLTSGQWMNRSNPANHGSEAASTAWNGLETANRMAQHSQAEAENRSSSYASKKRWIQDLSGGWHTINGNDYDEIKGVHGVYQKRTRQIFGFTLTAFAVGKPNILHYSADLYQRSLNRKFATKSLKGRGKEGLQRDEYPYASTREGGKGAMVAYVSASENSRQGGDLSALYKTLNDGDAFLVMTIPEFEDIPDPVFVPVPRTSPAYQPSPSFMEKMQRATGLTGTALIFYIIVSEGSRVFPPRNLVPLP